RRPADLAGLTSGQSPPGRFNGYDRCHKGCRVGRASMFQAKTHRNGLTKRRRPANFESNPALRPEKDAASITVRLPIRNEFDEDRVEYVGSRKAAVLKRPRFGS